MSDININRGSYRETNRNRVVGTQREPIGAARINGPKPNQPAWINGHIPGQGSWSYIPPQLCGKTRQAVLDEKRDTRKPKPLTAVGGCGGGRKRRGGKRRGKRAAALAKSLQRQDEFVAKYQAKKRLERDRQIAAWASTMKAVNDGRLVDAIKNGGMEVCNA
jgi:hypothetical protein